MKNVFALAIVFAALQLPAQEVNFNLIKNGTFDGNPVTQSWQIAVAAPDAVNRPTEGNPGSYADLNHNGGPDDPAIVQKIDGFKTGNVYVISGDYRAGYHAGMHCKSTGPVLAVDIDGHELKTFALPNPQSTWTRFTVSFTASSTSHILRLRGEINGTDCDVAVDNIVVQSEMAGWYRLTTQFRGDGESLEGNQAGSSYKNGAPLWTSVRTSPARCGASNRPATATTGCIPSSAAAARAWKVTGPTVRPKAALPL